MRLKLQRCLDDTFHVDIYWGMLPTFLAVSFSMIQTMKNPMNKSRQGIAAVYSARVEKMKTSANKRLKNQDKGSVNTKHVDVVEEKMRTNEGISESETVHTGTHIEYTAS